MSRLLALVSAMFLSVCAATAQTGEYPNRPIKIVVSVPAGGGVDSVTRLVAEKMRQQLGQAIIIEIAAANRAISAPKWCLAPSRTATP
jgi:tripartite-type tricarboxylate transporter receptor subunit TctC